MLPDTRLQGIGRLQYFNTRRGIRRPMLDRCRSVSTYPNLSEGGIADIARRISCVISARLR